MTLPQVGRALAVAVLGAAALGCGHAQQQGRYEFTADDIIRDPCGLLPSKEALWDGELIIDGSIVRFRYDLYDSELRGRYREVSDAFYADGSASNMSGTAHGVACTFDLVNIHVEGGPPENDFRSFSGQVRVHTRSLANDLCECDLETTFHATRVP